MAGNTTYTQTLDKVLALAASVPGIGTNRARQGFIRFSDTESLENAIAKLAPYTEGYFFAELGKVEKRYLDAPTFTIRASLHIYAPKDLSGDLDAAWDFAASVANNFYNPQNFIDADRTLALPRSIRWSLHALDTIRGPGIAVFDFGRFDGGLMEFMTA